MKLLRPFPVSVILLWIRITSSLPSKTKITPFSESVFPVAVNSTLDLACSLVDSKASVSDLQLKKCVPQTCKTLTPVRQTNTTKYYSQTFTSINGILIYYFCEFEDERNTSSHLGVIVGYKPTLPDTVDCISLDQSDLKCTWNIPNTTRLNTVKSTWTITYSDGALAYRECPEKSESDYSIGCHIPAQNDNLMDMFEPASDYSMNVTLNSSIGDVSRIYHISVLKNVKLTPPTMNIKPESNEIAVTLQLPEDFERNRNYDSKVEYLVTYRPTWSTEFKQVNISSDKESLSTILRNCVPYTKYIITMKAKPLTSLFWSDISEKEVTTKPDVPYDQPDTSEGLYMINNITSSSYGFTLFYKPLPKQFWNAENCVVNVTLSDPQNVVVWTGNFSITNVYLEIPYEITLPRYTATLRYINNQGPSDNATSLGIINEENKIVVTAEETKNGYVISWETEETSISVVTVMWCIRTSADICENDVEWRVFNNPGNSVRLRGVGYDTNKIFGVSVQRKDGFTAGLTYPKCYYQLQNSADQPKLAFTSRRNGTRQLLVDLVMPYCQYPSKPELYQVFYQKHTGLGLSCSNDLSKNITVKATYDLQTIPLSNVDPKISYDVCLGVTLANKRTMYSTVQTVTVRDAGSPNSDEDPTKMVAIISSVIVPILVILIVFILWLKRKYCSLDNDIKMPAIESFELPLLSNESNPGYKSELSEERDIRDIADSGTQSLPESVSSDEQGPDADRDSVSSGIGSTKCESDVFSPPTTPTDAGKITLVFRTEMAKLSRADHTTYTLTMASGNENKNPDHSTSGDQHTSSSCSNPIDSYAKGDWAENSLDEIRERLESSGNFSDYQHVMCSNYSSTCASDSENLDTCPSSPELTRNASQSTICDSDTMDDITPTLSSGNTSSLSTFHYNTNIQIDSSGPDVTNDPPYSFA